MPSPSRATAKPDERLAPKEGRAGVEEACEEAVPAPDVMRPPTAEPNDPDVKPEPVKRPVAPTEPVAGAKPPGLARLPAVPSNPPVALAPLRPALEAPTPLPAVPVVPAVPKPAPRPKAGREVLSSARWDEKLPVLGAVEPRELVREAPAPKAPVTPDALLPLSV